jgi:hypothetical protein
MSILAVDLLGVKITDSWSMILFDARWDAQHNLLYKIIELSMLRN